MQIGFIAFDSLLYFYGLDPSFPQPKMFIIPDMDGNVFLMMNYCVFTFCQLTVIIDSHGTLFGFVADSLCPDAPGALNNMLEEEK